MGMVRLEGEHLSLDGSFVQAGANSDIAYLRAAGPIPQRE
jgi:hypothetical protein